MTAPGGRTAARATLALTLSLLLAACAPTQQMAFTSSIDTVASLASEGALLAHDLVDRRVTATFAQQHGLDLLSLASEQSSMLAAETVPSGERHRLQELRSIAQRVESDLHKLTESGADPARLAEDLDQAARDAQQMSKAIS